MAKNEDPTVQRRFLKREDAYAMIQPKNRAILDAGHELTVSPGKTIRREKVGATQRYIFREKI